MNPFNLIPSDKVAHFLSGWALALTFALFTDMTAAVTVVICIAIAKEVIIDGWIGWGNPDKSDFIATVFGSLAAPALYAVKGLI